MTARFPLLSLWLSLFALLACSTQADELRGTRVEWARLKTDSLYWDRHADFDSVLLKFMRENTSLDIDPVERTVSAQSLSDLCTFPFIFVANARELSPEESHNLGEYLRRGGFVLMDLCLEPKITNGLKSLSAEVEILRAQFPRLQVAHLLPNHPIFSCYYDLSERRRAQAEENDKGESRNKDEERIGDLIGAFDGPRMIAVLSLSGLECDLAGFDRFSSPTGAAQIMTNIYIYALAGNRTRPVAPSP